MKTVFLILSVLIATMALAFGVEVEPLPGQSIADKVIEFLSSGTGAIVVGAIVEFALRFSKSAKPLSIMYLVAGMFKMVGSVFVKLGEFLDKVLPQRLK